MLPSDTSGTSPLIAQLLAAIGQSGFGQQGQLMGGQGGPMAIQNAFQGMAGNGQIQGQPAIIDFGLKHPAQTAAAGQYGRGFSNAGAAGSPPVQAGATGAAPGRGFVWGGRTWGPNEFSQFAAHLKSQGVDFAQWARAHPGAFASFNIDPRIKQIIGSGPVAAPAGGMAHA